MSKDSKSILIAAVLVVSVLAGAVPAGTVAATSNGPPSGMVGVADANVDDIRASGVETAVSEADVEGNVYVSEHAATTEVSLVTAAQASEVASGASPSDVAGERVCSTPAGAKSPAFDCGPRLELVVSDDVHDEGRRVAIKTSVLEESLGYVPEYIAVSNNETGETWQSAATVKDGWLVADLAHFSSNSVSWNGHVNISASPASDGKQLQWPLEDVTSASDPVLNLTGVNTTETDSVVAKLADGETVSLSVDGTASPRNAEVTFTNEPDGDGDQDVFFRRDSDGNATYVDDAGNVNSPGSISVYEPGGAGDIDGDGAVEMAYIQSSDYSVAWMDRNGNVTDTGVASNYDIGGIGDFNGDGDAEVVYRDSNDNLGYIDAAGNTGSVSLSSLAVVGGMADIDGDGDLDVVYTTSGTGGNLKYVDSAGNVVDTGAQAADVGGVSDWDGDGTLEIAAVDGNNNLEVITPGGSVTDLGVQGYSAGWFGDIDDDGDTDLPWEDTSANLRYIDPSGNTGDLGVQAGQTGGTADVDGAISPSLDVDSDGSTDASVTGLAVGSSTTVALENLSLSSTDATLSGAQAKVNITYTEVTETTDPGAELNTDNWLNHSGTLADGETISLTGNSSWLQNGTNYLNVSVGDGSLSADAPNPQVQLTLEHDAASKQSVTYETEVFSARYNISHTYASAKETANLTIPFGDRVVGVRDLEISRNGSSWSDLTDYSLDGTTLTARYGPVDANETIRIRTNASKVQVENGAIDVLEATAPGDSLSTRVEVTSTSSGDLALSVGGTTYGDRVHYTYNESYSSPNERAKFVGDSQQLVLPNAGAGSEVTVSTIPIEIGLASSTADVVISVEDPKTSEPEFVVDPGGSSGDSVEYTHLFARDGETYNLKSLSRGVVVDSGTAQSPLTLEDDDSSETLAFLLDDSTSTTDPDDDEPPKETMRVGVGGAAVTVETTAFIGAMAALLVGIWFVTNRFGSGDGIKDRTLFYGIGVLAVTMGLETLSPQGLFATIFGTLTKFVGRGLATAMPLVILVVGFLGYRYLKTQGTPQKVVNFKLGGGRGGS